MTVSPSDRAAGIIRQWSSAFDRQWSCRCLEGIRFGPIREPWNVAGDHPQIPMLRMEFCLERQISVSIQLGDHDGAVEYARMLGRELVECELHRCGRNAVRHLASVGTFSAFRSALACFMQLGRYGKVELRQLLEPWIEHLRSFQAMVESDPKAGFETLRDGLRALHEVSLQTRDPIDAWWAKRGLADLRQWRGIAKKRRRRAAFAA